MTRLRLQAAATHRDQRNRELRVRLLGSLSAAGLVVACGGNVSGDGNATGSGGTAGSVSSGGASSGGVSSGGAAGWGGSTAGTAGTSIGGAGAGGTGAGGTGAGGTGAGGTGATGAGGTGAGGTGAGGTGGFGPEYFTEGTVDCSDCGGTTWTTCWREDVVPNRVDESCPPYVYTEDTVCSEEWQQIGYDLQVDSPHPGYCCYNSYVQCLGGRPFLVANQHRQADTVARDDWALAHECQATGSEEVDLALSALWLADAQMEHASVAAFARLSLQLMALGAPPELIIESQQASLDEIDHARRCYGLAATYSSAPVGPGALNLQDAVQPVTLAELAELAFEEGCAGETIAALSAQANLDALGEHGKLDPALEDTLRVIVDDETRHAELSWRIVGWSLNQLDSVGRRALLDRLSARLVELQRQSDHQLRISAKSELDLRAHGRVSKHEQQRIRADALNQVVAPCLEAMGAPAVADRTDPAGTLSCRTE